MNSIFFESIGTQWTIDLPEGSEKIKAKILEFLESFDKTYSRFRDDSLISKISKRSGDYVFPESARQIFPLYKKLYRLTDGKFTPVAGDLLSSLGYDKDYSFTPKKIKRVKKWEDAIEFEGRKLNVKSPVILDFGAAGKGYAIDGVGKILSKNKVHNFSIDAGGDILVRGNKTNRIGLEHPYNPNQVIGVVEIRSGSICASSGNKRTWDRYHHIMDPKILSSTRDVFATWVIAEKAFIADALATCLFFTSPDKLKSEFDFEYLIVYPDLSIDKSEKFDAEIYYTKN